MDCKTGGLSKETHASLKVTTNAITEIAVYCNENFGLNFILPGKFQTDNLESRFGLYRQMSGSNYHISIRQLFETEKKKIRIRSLLKLGISSKTFGQVLIMNIDLQDFGDVDEGSAVLSFWPSIHVDGKDSLIVLWHKSHWFGYAVPNERW
ncbi:hypothetical protein AVEN_150405-1 [Araneus ventricosus]|uniref:Uncharacterized protein n=1 Tax=Araneus ventricosus TaxID=182803 RepID=A0A4Y2QZX3_ARAVE|nr:hypothetical protein AVEN_150405-1 [Araneus ventricosus]